MPAPDLLTLAGQDLDHARQYLLANPAQVDPAAVTEQIEQARELLYGELRHLQPAPQTVTQFLGLARLAYLQAEMLRDHRLSAEAALLLSDLRRGKQPFLEKEYWGLVYALHSTLTYPQPKFGSTFDIIISTTVQVFDGLHDSELAAGAVFLRRMAVLVQREIGAQAVVDLLKFIEIPHDTASTAASLLYLAELHRAGLDARPARAAFTSLPRRWLLEGVTGLSMRLLMLLLEAPPGLVAGESENSRLAAHLADLAGLPPRHDPAGSLDLHSLVAACQVYILASWQPPA